MHLPMSHLATHPAPTSPILIFMYLCIYFTPLGFWNIEKAVGREEMEYEEWGAIYALGRIL